MADRFFCPDTPVDGCLVLDGDEARHLSRVRRVGLGECVELFDGRGSSYQAEVVGLGRDRVELKILEARVQSPIAHGLLTLATSVPKGDRFDWLVEKATELGVARLIPLVTERSVVDPRAAKLDRLRRVVIEASKQCRRDRLMEIDPPTTLVKILERTPGDVGLIAHPGGPPIAASGLNLLERSTILAIGPEGGFTPAEIEAARSRNWQVVGFGQTVLRIETAALAGAALVLGLAESRRFHERSKED